MTYFEIVAGCYEEFLLGYKFSLSDSSLKQSFASHDHSSSIRCLAISGNYMASGAADDRIIIYDLKSRKEHCMLTQHAATINCLQFTENHSHIVSGSADGVLSIVRVGNWQIEKLWEKAHKGQAILDVAIHSSGKLALTLGADASLITWNLVKGRQTFIVNLNNKSKDARSLEKILWANDGIRFILYGGKYTEIWSIQTGGILKIIEHEIRVTSCIWLSDDKILVGNEDGQLSRVKISNLSRKTYNAHCGRIKAMLKYNSYVISGSSTGEIKVWNRNIEELAKIDSGCRITCLSVIPLVTVKKEEKDDEKSIEVSIESSNKVIKKSTVIVEVEESEEEIKDIKQKFKKQMDSKRKTKKQNNYEHSSEDQNGENISHELIEEINSKKKKKRKIT